MVNGKSWYYSLHLTEIIVTLSILVSGFILFSYEHKQNNPDYQKSWVAFYFVDPNSPEEGVALENHLGADSQFTFCLVPDSDDLMEPTDLSCSLGTVTEAVTKNITKGISAQWLYPLPSEPGKYWVVAEYKDSENILRSRDLSFEIP